MPKKPDYEDFIDFRVTQTDNGGWIIQNDHSTATYGKRYAFSDAQDLIDFLEKELP